MKKTVLITVVAAYVFGAASYLIAFVALNWAGFDRLVDSAAEGVGRALIWPYLIYAWLRFDMPLI